MPSITFWNHLEPSPRARDSERGLAAEVRDAAWMLARQWQLGEFWGEDAGSPAHVTIEYDRQALDGWQAADGAWHTLLGERSLEQQMLGEPVTGGDLLTRVELGHVFERLLADAVADSARPGGVLERYRTAFRLRPEAVGEWADVQEAREFTALCGAIVDGVDLWRRLAGAPRLIPAEVTVTDLASGGTVGVQNAQDAFVRWVREVFGELHEADPASWVPSELEHRGGLRTAPIARERLELAVRPGLRGEVEAYSLDALRTASSSEVAVHRSTMVPGHLRVRGMPNARFWDFEREDDDPGAVTAEPRDLARLVYLETALTQGNDWFLVPLRLPVGTACRVRSLRVTDVFGVVVEVPRAGTLAASPTRRWRMFGHAAGDEEDPGWRVLLPECSRATVASPPIEEVRFLRDEMANLVWSVEGTWPDAFGAPLNARDAVALRAAEGASGTHAIQASRPEGAPRLSYQLQTDVPRSWVPWVTVRASTTAGDVVLELSRISSDEGPLRTRILQPSIPPPYRMPEHVVPPGGVRVVREFVKVREADGTSRLWIRRRRTSGMGEAESGLQFDRVQDR